MSYTFVVDHFLIAIFVFEIQRFKANLLILETQRSESVYFSASLVAPKIFQLMGLLSKKIVI